MWRAGSAFLVCVAISAGCGADLRSGQSGDADAVTTSDTSATSPGDGAGGDTADVVESDKIDEPGDATDAADTSEPETDTAVAVDDTSEAETDTTVAVDDTGEPETDTTVAVDDTGEPETDTTVSVDDTTVLDDTTVPVDDTTVLDDTTVPVDDTTVAPDETTTPVDDATVPVDDTTVLDDSTVPVDDTTVLEDTTVAPDDTTVAVEDTTGPVDDTTVTDDASEPCGGCTAPAVCMADGVCRATASGRVFFERRQPNPARTALEPIAVAPVVGREVVLVAGGVELGRAVTDADGAFAVSFAGTATGPISAVLAAVVTDAAGALDVAVLDAAGVTWPTTMGVPIDTTRIWSWTWSAPDGGGGLDLGDTTLTAANGSGALALLASLERSRAHAADAFGADLAELPTLGVIWSPVRTPPCLSCYLPDGWGPVVLHASSGDVTFGRGFLISGADAAPQHWTPALVAHELGHHVMETFSRIPVAGGAHSWTSRLWPPLAWSEGFATFFGQWSLSTLTTPDPRYFTMQQNIQYWVDIEAIGTTPTTDDTSLNATFPLPNAAGAMDQTIGEAVVAAILWDLFDEADLEDESFSLGDAALTVISEPRLATATIDRGKLGPDLVDYLDALACGGYADPAELLPLLFGFPWDGAPQCLP